MTARFLLVEDHAPLAQTLASAARRVGKAHIASTVARGLDLVVTYDDWAGLILDVTMPDGNGLDVLAFARERGVVAPAVVLTAVHDRATINRAYDLEGRYLVKPVDPRRLLAFLSRAGRQPTTEDLAREWGGRYHLTETEIAILLAGAEGSERDQVAFDRGIATTTLKKHVHNLLRKTGDASLLAAGARMLRDRAR